MLMSDLLKSTGYDCPEGLQGRTFEEATAGGDVQTNKSSTIDVSAYTEPIVIEPDTDYESMKKNTVTLSNIPEHKTEEDLSVTENGEYTPDDGKTYGKVTVNVPQGVSKLYAWKGDTKTAYTTTEQPTVGSYAYVVGTASLVSNNINEVGEGYIATGASAEHKLRYSEGDITF
jgi:hypothetical protein